MPEASTQLYLGDVKIDYLTYGDSLVGINTFTASPFDPDAEAFINVTGISGSNATAINNLVVSLKNQNMWVDMVAIYPMIGGTSTTHKYNLKDPQDTDAAFRLSFAGGWTHNNSGAKPDGVSGTYANTFFVPQTHFAGLNDAHVSYYSFTNAAGADDVEIGATNAAAGGETLLAMRFSDNNQYVFVNKIGGSGGAPGASNGYMVGVRNGTATLGYRNAVQVVNTSSGTAAFTSRELYLGAQNDGTTGYRNSSRGCSFASIGYGLDGANLSTIVNSYQTELGRNQY
jgi:hypothetical protein